jgi:hypothetical protein
VRGSSKAVRPGSRPSRDRPSVPKTGPAPGRDVAASIPWPHGILGRPIDPAGPSGSPEIARVLLWPWEYLFQSFDRSNFPDIYWPILIASVGTLIAAVIMYNVRTRQLHRHQIYVQMYEWILWTCVIVFSLIIVYGIFRFDWIIVLSTIVTGLVVLIWIRFFHFPPYFAAYERQLAKRRYYSRERFTHPEATIRTKSSRRRRRR